MAGFFEQVGSFFSSVWGMLTSMTIIDVVDILLLAFILYYVYKFIQDKHAERIVIGIIFVILIFFVSDLVGMYTIKFLLQNVLQVGIIALVVLFQKEIRVALEKVGNNPLGVMMPDTKKDHVQVLANISEICSAVKSMSDDRTGALIVIERKTKLGVEITSGTRIDAKISSSLIKNIFFNKSPLHDGALLIIDGRLHTAGCVLPHSTNEDIDQELGTRHRAAIGMSENSDAAVICVSEETGTISLALNGVLKRGYTENSLKVELEDLLIDENYLGKIRSKGILRKKDTANNENNND